MAVFSIYDGRTSFWQWDVGQRLIVYDDVCCEVHFCNGTTECALVCEVYEEDGKRLVNVPNILLQTGKPLRVFAFAQSDSDERTILSEMFTVIPRTKPDDYVYTETEVWTAEKAVEKAVAEAVASGDFKGDKGDKGDPGVVKFVVVAELPETDTENAIYLVPITESGENNLFDEYIFVDGKWEKIGSAAVAVDLTGYVKDTDYPDGGNKAGVVKTNPADYGIGVYPTTGYLYVTPANEKQIDEKTHVRRPIVPATLDYAVKAGITKNAISLTNEEKVQAQAWLGVPTKDELAQAVIAQLPVYNGEVEAV